MRRASHMIAVVAVLATTLSLVGCGGKESQPAPAVPASGQVFELKLGHMTPETEPYHLAALKFKDLIEKRSNGRVKITIYPAGQLGYDRELIEGLQFGSRYALPVPGLGSCRERAQAELHAESFRRGRRK